MRDKQPIEERRATLAAPGITTELLKSNEISTLVINDKGIMRRYAYSFL